ncbi:MAG TPA: hypothetical protein VH744_01640, partial [Terriglobales bacterium]
MPDATIEEREKSSVRTVVFNHLAGIVLVPTVKALSDRNVFSLFGSPGTWVGLDEIVARTHSNRGYIKVALRLLASCGWMQQETGDHELGPSYALTDEGAIALRIAPPLYAEVAAFIPKALFLEDFLFG